MLFRDSESSKVLGKSKYNKDSNTYKEIWSWNYDHIKNYGHEPMSHAERSPPKLSY